MPKNELNKLTASFVSGLKKYSGKDLPDDMPSRWSDGGGLFLRYDKKSKRFYWRMKYYFAGKDHLAGYGTFPDVSLAEARAFRDRDRKLLASGINPAEQRREDERNRRKELLTYEKLAREWHATQELNPKSHTNAIQQLENHVFPVIGARPYSEVTRRELADILAGVAAQKNKRTGEGKVFTAKKLAGYFSQIDDFGEAKGLIESNRALRLTRALPPIPNKKGFAAVLDLPGISVMLKRITAYYSGNEGSPYSRVALRLIPYLGFRISALLGARWSEIDLDRALWTIEAEEMRTKWTDGARTFPLPTQVIALLQELAKLKRNGSDYLFPTHSRSGHLSREQIEKLHKDVVCFDGLKHVPHAWRKVFSTLAREAGAPMVLTETSLAHAAGGAVERTYNKAEYLRARAILMQWYANALDELEAGKELPALPQITGFAHYEA